MITEGLSLLVQYLASAYFMLQTDRFQEKPTWRINQYNFNGSNACLLKNHSSQIHIFIKADFHLVPQILLNPAFF